MKVLIVGAGIVGPTLASWLLRAGHEAALLERGSELRRGIYPVDFRGAGFDVVARMGVVPELSAIRANKIPRVGIGHRCVRSESTASTFRLRMLNGCQLLGYSVIVQ